MNQKHHQKSFTNHQTSTVLDCCMNQKHHQTSSTIIKKQPTIQNMKEEGRNSTTKHEQVMFHVCLYL
jgi:hypothetical protein